jgi:hypothetical protein
MNIEDLAPYIDRCKDVLDAKKSGILGDRNAESVGLALNKEGSVRRVWNELSSRDIYIYKQFLDYYTDASNCTDGGGPASNYVIDPYVGDATNGKIQVFGKYRNAFTIVRPMADDKYMLIQELRSGYIESLVSDGLVDYSEARVESIDWYNPDGVTPNQDYITLAWKGVSPNDVEAIAESLKSLPAENWSPSVNGNALGSHHRLMVRTAEENDGSATVRVMLANSRVKFESYSSWKTERQALITYHFNVPTDLVPAIIATEKNVGVTVRVGAPDQRGLHDVVVEESDPDQLPFSVKTQKACSFETNTEYRFGLTTTQIPVATSQNGTIQTIRVQSRGDGLFDVAIETRTTIQTDLPEYTAESSSGRDVKRREVKGYIGANPVATTVVGEVARVNVSLNADCSKDAVVEKIISKQQDGENIRKAAKSESIGTLKTNVRNPTTVKNPLPGETIIYEKRPNIDGTFDITERVDKSPELSIDTVRETLKGSDKGTGKRNAKVAKEQKPPSPGETIVYEKRENEDGTFDWQERIEKSPDLSSETSRTSLKAGSQGIGARNAITPKTPDGPTTAKIVTYEKRENEDGTYDWQERIDESPILANKETILTPKKVVIGNGVKNARTAPSAPGSAQPGQRITYRESENEDGTFDHMTTIESTISGLLGDGKAETICGELGEDGVLLQATKKEVDDKVKDLQIGLSAGEKLIFSRRENENGSWDLSYRIEEAPKLESESQTIRKKGGIVETIRRNIGPDALEQPGDPEIGVTKFIRNDENADCSWDQTIRIETAPELISEQIVKTKNAEIESIVLQNTPEKAEIGDITDTQTVQITNDENPDGTWKTSRSVTTPLPQEFETDYYTADRKVTVTVFINYTKDQVKDLAINLPRGNTNNVSASPNEFGLYNGSVTSAEVAREAGGGSSVDYENYEYLQPVGFDLYRVTVRYTNNEQRAANLAGQTLFTTDKPAALGESAGVYYVGRGKFKGCCIRQGRVDNPPSAPTLSPTPPSD